MSHEAAGRLTIAQLTNLQLEGKATDAGASFGTYEEFALYRKAL